MPKLVLILLFAVTFTACQSRPNMDSVKPYSNQDSLTDTAQSPTLKSGGLSMADVLYTKSDSIEVCRLLADTKRQSVLDFARYFIGRPYVAHTLEVADPERLVVNLRELDCTTLVETTLALAITRQFGERTFESYCRNLDKIRYFKSAPYPRTYLDRLHYFSFWMHDNIDAGIVQPVDLPEKYTKSLNVKLDYMTRNSPKYKILAAHPEWVSAITALETQYSGADGEYLPHEYTALDKQTLSAIADGDIVAIVTTKAGIDYSHLGFAVWGKDGKLHLLNASSIHHKVVEEPMTLKQYLQKHPSSIGIRLLRLKTNRH